MIVKMIVKGSDPTSGGDPFEESVVLYDVPRVGDKISVWTGDNEAYIEITEVIWPTWTYTHDPASREPELWLQRPEEMTDEEWKDIFVAIKEKRTP